MNLKEKLFELIAACTKKLVLEAVVRSDTFIKRSNRFVDLFDLLSHFFALNIVMSFQFIMLLQYSNLELWRIMVKSEFEIQFFILFWHILIAKWWNNKKLVEMLSRQRFHLMKYVSNRLRSLRDLERKFTGRKSHFD